MNKKFEYDTIGHLSLENWWSALMYTKVGDPLPLIKKFERTDLDKMETGKGVCGAGIKDGDWVVINRSR